MLDENISIRTDEGFEYFTWSEVCSELSSLSYMLLMPWVDFPAVLALMNSQSNDAISS